MDQNPQLQKDRRALKRGTLPGLVAAVCFSGVFLLANVPGNPVVGPYILHDGKYGPHFEPGVPSMVHGWPWVFLDHDGFDTKLRRRYSAWSIGTNSHWSPLALVANAMVLVVGATLIGWWVRRRIQRRGWQFGIRDLLIAMSCVSLVMGYCGHRRHVRLAQIALLQRQERTIDGYGWQPFGPYWLRQCIGERWFEWGDHLVYVDLDTSDAIRELPGKSEIKVLRMFLIDGKSMPPLDGYDRLLAIDVGYINWSGVSLDDDDVPTEALPCWRVIANCRTIQGLNLYEGVLDDRGLQDLAQLPDLQHLDLTDNRGVTDAGLAHLATVKSLRKLNLYSTRVSRDGVAKLQAALPDCEIGWEESEY